MRWLDLLHARYHNDGLFFSAGWGKEEILDIPLIQSEVDDLPSLEPIGLQGGDRVLRFSSPRAEILPPESKIAEALLIVPPVFTRETPVCLQLAATGDQGFSARKRLVAEPLRELGIASIILENPYYGSRRPLTQEKTYLRSVSDLWAMGLAIVAETRALIRWLVEQEIQTIGVCGVSMGGAMASQVVAQVTHPVAMCACVAPHCATPVFLEGVLSRFVDWERLSEEGGRERLARQLDGSCLRLFPIPPRTDCALWLAARQDAYVSPTSSLTAAECWPGSNLVWLNSGHVGTSMFFRNQYVRSVVKSLNRLISGHQSHLDWIP